MEILRSIVRATASAGLSLIVFDIEHQEDLDEAIHRVATHGFVDGLLMVSLVPTSDQIRAITASGPRLVMIDAFHPEVDSVEIDHAYGAYLAVSYFTNQGHRRVGFIGRPDDPFSHGLGQRREGYLQALVETNLIVDETLLIPGEYSRDSGSRGMEQLLQLNEPPSAIFASSDLQAIGAMSAIRDAGLRVPNDIAVIGYNDVELAEYVSLSTVRLPLEFMGQEAVRLLTKGLYGNRSEPQHVHLCGELIIRDTSGGPVNRKESEKYPLG